MIELPVPSSATVHGPPRGVMIELTNHCQLACVTCPRDKQDAHDYELGSMSVETFAAVWSQFAGSAETLDLTGLGESLMHPGIFEIIRHVRQTSTARIYLTTNTLLLTPRIIGRLVEEPVDTLCVSIDGVDQAQYSSMRGKVNLRSLCRRVTAARAAISDRTEFILCVVLMEANLASMVEFVDLAAELGIRRVSLKPVNLVAHPLPTSYYHQFTTTRFADLADRTERRGRELGVRVEVFRVGRYQCSFPWDPVYITWDGYLVACCAKPFPKRMHFGNVLDAPFEALKNGPEIVSFRRQLLDPDDAPAYCDKCHIMGKTMFRDRASI